MYVCLYIPMTVRFYLLKVDLVASSGLYLEVVSGAMKVIKKLQYKPFPVRVFAAIAINQDIKCNFEIIEAKWLAEQYIPEEYDSITD